MRALGHGFLSRGIYRGVYVNYSLGCVGVKLRVHTGSRLRISLPSSIVLQLLQNSQNLVQVDSEGARLMDFKGVAIAAAEWRAFEGISEAGWRSTESSIEVRDTSTTATATESTETASKAREETGGRTCPS